MFQRTWTVTALGVNRTEPPPSSRDVGATWLPAATSSLLGAETLVVLLHDYRDSVRHDSGSGTEDPTSLPRKLASNTWLSGGGSFCSVLCLCLRRVALPVACETG